MKTASLSIFSFIICCIHAYSQNLYYAASKSGLNMREKADVNSAVLTKIPYGEKISFLDLDYSTDLKTEGMDASWMHVSYGGKIGYIANIYALPFPPPNPAGDLESYAKQLGKATATWSDGPDFETDTTVNDGSLRVEKTFYNNGIVYRSMQGWEWGSETIWVPRMSMQQAFVLARLLCTSTELLNTNDAFPVRSVLSSDTNPREIRVLSYFENSAYPEMIHFEICDGGCQWIEIRNEDGEISITFAAGV